MEADERDRVTAVGALQCLLSVVGVVIFFTWLDNYGFIVGSSPPPVRLVLLFTAAAAALALAALHRPIPVGRSPVAIWLGAHFLATTLWGMTVSSQGMQVLNDRVRSIAFLVAFAIIFNARRAARIAVWAVAAMVLFASAVNVAELLGTVQFSEVVPGRVIGRAGGFYINPNASGITIVVGLAVAATTLRARWLLPLLLVGAVGVAATFSRGAAACLVVLLAWIFWSRAIPRRVLALSAAVSVIVGSTVGTELVQSRRLLNENTASRLYFTADDSGRGQVARKAWRMFGDEPLIGHGLGATTVWDTEVSSHNMYLNLAGDQGVVGLLTFPALLVALAATGPAAIPLALVLAIAGLSSHGMLDDRATLIAIALAASVASLRAASDGRRSLATWRAAGSPPEAAR